MDLKEIYISIYIVVSLAAIVVLSILLYNSKKNNKESFKKCLCSSETGARVCQDTEQVWKNYQNGMTEYMNLPKREWSKISPGDIDYPPNRGACQSVPYQENYEYSSNQPQQGIITLQS